MIYLLNSKISHRHRLLLNVTVKINLKRNYRYVALSNLSVCYTWKNREKTYMNNKFKKSAQTWSGEFELPDGSYSVSGFQYYFGYTFTKNNMEKRMLIHQ